MEFDNLFDEIDEGYEGNDPIPTEVIKIQPGKDLATQAFTSNVFAQRVNEGIRIVLENTDESAIIVLASMDGKKLAYPQITRGETVWTPDSRHIYSASVSVLPEALDLKSPEEYEVLGLFHFHPDNSGFSYGDMQGYIAMKTKANNAKLGKTFAIHERLHDGLFTPTFGKPSIYNERKIERLRLLMISGEPTEFYYERKNFPHLDLQRQADVLTDCGLKTKLIDIPLDKKHRANFTPLRHALK